MNVIVKAYKEVIAEQELIVDVMPIVEKAMKDDRLTGEEKNIIANYSNVLYRRGQLI